MSICTLKTHLCHLNFCLQQYFQTCGHVWQKSEHRLKCIICFFLELNVVFLLGLNSASQVMTSALFLIFIKKWCFSIKCMDFSLYFMFIVLKSALILISPYILECRIYALHLKLLFDMQYKIIYYNMMWILHGQHATVWALRENVCWSL